MSNEFTYNPYETPAVAEAKKPVKHFTYGWRATLAKCIAGLMLAGSFLAAALAYWDIETIVGSGPIYFLASLILGVLALRWAPKRLLVIASAYFLFVLSILAVINIFSLSPQEAQEPVSILIWAFTCFAQTGWVLVLWRDSRGEPNANMHASAVATSPLWTPTKT